MSRIFSAQTSPFRKALVLTFKNFSLIDGKLRAAAFAFYLFFSLFPVIILFVTVSSFFLDSKTAAREVIGYFQNYTPLNAEMKRNVFDTIGGVVEARGQVGMIALIALIWGSLQLFTALTNAVNRAWGTEHYSWWRLPLKNLLVLLIMASAIAIGITTPMIFQLMKEWWFPNFVLNSWAYLLAMSVVPFFVLFYGLSLFYQFAPRRNKHFRQVRAAALIATVLLLILESLFATYINNFAKFNLVYGAFGGIIALLLWVYLSGYIIIMGACFSAAQAEIRNK